MNTITNQDVTFNFHKVEEKNESASISNLNKKSFNRTEADYANGYVAEKVYEQFMERFMKELDAATGKIKQYLVLKDKLDEEGRQGAPNKPWMTLSEIRSSIKEREVKITRFIETLSDNQITVLYLLFQTGCDLQIDDSMASDGVHKDIRSLLYTNMNEDFNFTRTNNLQFKLSYFHDYLFARRDSILHVRRTLKELKVSI